MLRKRSVTSYSHEPYRHVVFRIVAFGRILFAHTAVTIGKQRMFLPVQAAQHRGERMFLRVQAAQRGKGNSHVERCWSDRHLRLEHFAA
jgi:hypothetical protein